MTQTIHVLLAARGNPDKGQNPNQVPYGAPADTLAAVTTMQQAAAAVRAYIESTEIGGGNWVGGDVWLEGVHQGHYAFNANFIACRPAPLVRTGAFVYSATRLGPTSDPVERMAESLRQFLRDPVAAARNIAGTSALEIFDATSAE